MVDDDIYNVVGVVVAVIILVKLLYCFYDWKCLYFNKPAINYADYGPWIIVTGCTSGIGKEFAIQFAKRGLNIVLVSRNFAKLNDVSHELQQSFPNIKTRIVVIDFASNDDVQYDDLKNAIADLKVGMLINNAGMGTGSSYFQPDDKEINNAAVVNCNCIGPTKMLRFVMPGMVSSRKGLIVNISSFASSKLFGFEVIYCASKRFLDTFSRGLFVEYANENIIVQSVKPLYVLTNLTKDVLSSKPTLFAPNPEIYVDQCLRAIGKRDVIHGYIYHEIQALMLSLIPNNVFVFLVTKWMKRQEVKKLKANT